MSTADQPQNADQSADQTAAPELPRPNLDDSGYVALLDRLAIAGTALAEDLQYPPYPGQKRAQEFDLYGRNVRLSIMLARQIKADPNTKAARQSRHKDAVEKIIRDVQDNIQRRADGPKAEALERELLERLEDPRLEADLLSDRPIREIVAEICRDLRVTPANDPSGDYKRRTPADIQSLRDLAASILGRHAHDAEDPGPKTARPEAHAKNQR